MLDYAILSRSLSMAIKLEPELRSPWPTHLGMTLAIFRRPRAIHANILWVPRTLPHPPIINGKREIPKPAIATGALTALTWSQSSTRATTRTAPKTRGPRVLVGSLAPPFAQQQPAAEKVSASFSRWAKTVEVYFLSGYGVPEKEWNKFQGRGAPPIVRFRLILPTINLTTDGTTANSKILYDVGVVVNRLRLQKGQNP